VYDDNVLKHANLKPVVLNQGLTVNEALEHLRRNPTESQIIYFYVLDDDGRLVGVLPTRRLLMSEPDAPIASLMITRLISLPETATVGDASEFFVLHRLLALPIVDGKQRLLGAINVSVLSDEVFDIAERRNVDGIFESIGVRFTDSKDLSAFGAFRARFPWLTATLAGGTACALLAGLYEATLAQSIVLAFFLTLVLGLGESVAAQSLTMTVQRLRTARPTLRWFVGAARREVLTTLMLGLLCGTIAGALVMAWKGEPTPALVVGGSISIALVVAGMLGVGVPWALHALKLDPRVAAGPLTLALADLATLAVYFNLGMLLLAA
jgi:magnesium transporter